MSGKELHYFAGDHTAKGFHPLYASNFQGLEHIIQLLGGHSHLKSGILQRVAKEWKEKGYEVEVVHSSSDSKALDSVIFPQLNVAIHGQPIHTRGFGDWTEKLVDVDSGMIFDKLNSKKEVITSHRNQIMDAQSKAYQSFKAGLDVHDDLESIYISKMDFTKADELTQDFIQRLEIPKKTEDKKPLTKHRFFGASTPEGVIDFIPNVTADLANRYFVKGRAGTGKSTFLKKVALAAEENKYDVEMYHCGFDPDSIDMIVVRELGFCVFDSTDPHEYFPEREGDRIIDLYAETVTAGTDEKYAPEISALTKGYKSHMKDGIVFLQQAKSCLDELSKVYEEATPDTLLDELHEAVCKEIESYM
ncbi:hypothetical protein [Halobacillus seohaensis]|uniref:Nucleotide kinase n=1 Tax=Halobacillus seohaensis TaxID=447421 RepID=A0ABW2EI66_9BACI